MYTRAKRSCVTMLATIKREPPPSFILIPPPPPPLRRREEGRKREEERKQTHTHTHSARSSSLFEENHSLGHSQSTGRSQPERARVILHSRPSPKAIPIQFSPSPSPSTVVIVLVLYVYSLHWFKCALHLFSSLRSCPNRIIIFRPDQTFCVRAVLVRPCSVRCLAYS